MGMGSLTRLSDGDGIYRADLKTIGQTHVHLDHAGGAGTLASECPNAEVVVHGNGAPHLADPTAIVAGTKQVMGDFWECYTEPEPIERERIETGEDGDSVRVGNRTVGGRYPASGARPVRRPRIS